MRRLTLILSDLYLPAEASSDSMPAVPAALPNLDALLSSSAAPVGIGEWRHWLATHLGFPALAEIPVATLAARGLLPQTPGTSAWLAVPVRLEARLDHVRLVDRGLLRIARSERAALVEEFATAFGPTYALHDAGDRAFLLSGCAPVRIASMDPARLLDTDIASGVLKGSEARELRRLASELDMWMHGSALNVARARAGAPQISSLWLWGGGTSDADESAAAAADSSIAILGGDTWLGGFARSVTHQPLRDAPKSFAELESNDHVVIELAPMSGASRDGLTALDAQWFAPIRAALSNGDLGEVHLAANDRVFRVTARPDFRFWRRQRSWLESLKVKPRTAKA